MGVYNDDNKLVIVTVPKPIHFDLPKDGCKNFVHEIDYAIKPNGFLPEHAIKNEISQLLSKYKHGNDIHEHRKQEIECTTQTCS